MREPSLRRQTKIPDLATVDACALTELGKAPCRTFERILIKPSHYDDDGYVIQWIRSSIPSNSLAAVYGLALDCAQRKVLGPEVDVNFTAWEETNTRIVPAVIMSPACRATRAHHP